MLVKISPDMEIMMEVDLQGVNERSRDYRSRDYDVQLYEGIVRDALIERLKKIFPEEDIRIYSVDVGVAREKYAKPRAA